MPRPERPSTTPSSAPLRPGADAGPPGAPSALTPEQRARWADLVAAGEAEFPEGLTPEQEQQLRHQVQRLRRDRLVRFIARQIAQDVGRDGGPLETR